MRPVVHVQTFDTTSNSLALHFAGGRLSLSVSVTNFNIPIDVTWTRNGMEVTNATEHVTIISTGLEEPPASSTLTVDGLRGSDGGMYQVTAVNMAGQSSAEFDVTVYGKCGRSLV